MHVRANKHVDVYTCKGGGETKWNGWFWNILLYCIIIYDLLLNLKEKNKL